MLAIHGGTPVFSASEGAFRWPQYDAEDERALVEQLHDSVSIYDRSGVFKEFEEMFASMHGRPHALLANSGTSAVFSMFEGLNLRPGKEVLCPVYTFHATVSPLMYTGAVPVFCDSDRFGNIRLDEIIKRYTAQTKAVIVTHMWGMPVAQINEIAAFCTEKGIALFEDCSHAHGATIGGKLVGTFGTAAAWSLQGQKTVTGGEGGIMLTSSQEIYERAVLQGHYNKRAKTEINTKSPLYPYVLTGLGQKLRAHPLAIRLALRQLGKLDAYLAERNRFAARLATGVESIPFIEVMTAPEGSTGSNYAFVMRYRAEKAYGVTRARFVEALHAEGLREVDIPTSTGLLHTEPLFTTPNEVLSRLYSAPLPVQEGYAEAHTLYDEIIKLPVWTFPHEEAIVEGYIQGIQKVATHIVENGTL